MFDRFVTCFFKAYKAKKWDVYIDFFNKTSGKFLTGLLPDIEEALSAAHAVGDDAIQSKMQGHVVPDSFTHGSSEQRMKWFMKGFKSGDIRLGDTFAEEL